VDFSTIHVGATPEVIIVDQHGTVKAAWLGKLGKSQEAEVFAQLNTAQPRAMNSHPSQVPDEPDYISPQDVARLLREPSTLLVDTRTRTAFAEAHIKTAINMPIDEISQRADHELPHNRQLVIYCGPSQASGCLVRGQQGSELPTTCSAMKRIFAVTGFPNIQLVSADLSLLSHVGVGTVGHCGGE
jgi:hypothetical protein